MTPSPTIRLFVSSTFSDLKAGRDALQRDVFPRLKQLCLPKGLRFQAIDLRWGIGEEAAALRDNGLDEIVRAAAPAPWAFISMKETFAGVNFDSSFADGSHLRPAGHQFLADTLARLILNTPELNAALKPSSSKR